MKKISILEVGGGIGATTDRVLEKWKIRSLNIYLLMYQLSF